MEHKDEYQSWWINRLITRSGYTFVIFEAISSMKKHINIKLSNIILKAEALLSKTNLKVINNELMTFLLNNFGEHANLDDDFIDEIEGEFEDIIQDYKKESIISKSVKSLTINPRIFKMFLLEYLSEDIHISHEAVILLQRYIEYYILTSIKYCNVNSSTFGNLLSKNVQTIFNKITTKTSIHVAANIDFTSAFIALQKYKGVVLSIPVLKEISFLMNIILKRFFDVENQLLKFYCSYGDFAKDDERANLIFTQIFGNMCNIKSKIFYPDEYIKLEPNDYMYPVDELYVPYIRNFIAYNYDVYNDRIITPKFLAGISKYLTPLFEIIILYGNECGTNVKKFQYIINSRYTSRDILDCIGYEFPITFKEPAVLSGNSSIYRPSKLPEIELDEPYPDQTVELVYNSTECVPEECNNDLYSSVETYLKNIRNGYEEYYERNKSDFYYVPVCDEYAYDSEYEKICKKESNTKDIDMAIIQNDPVFCDWGDESDGSDY